MLVGDRLRPVAIVGGSRIPFARSMGAYAEASNQDMLTAALKGVVDRFGLQGQVLGDVGAGAVLKHPRDYSLTRESVMSSGLAVETPGFDLQRACGTSLETAVVIGMKIALGQIDCGIAAGVDTASDVPIGVGEGLRRALLRSSRGRTLGARLRPWLALRPRDLKPQLPAVVEPRTGLSMGQSCELMARTWQISRESQDQFALESHRRAIAAREKLREEIVPVFAAPDYGMVQDDIGPRDNQTLEALAKLKPYFEKPDGRVTVGNSCGITDGACALLVTTAERAAELGLTPLARIVSFAYAGLDPARMGLGPVHATARLLERIGGDIGHFDLIEMNEAFAAQMLACLAAFESDDYARTRLDRHQALGPIDRERLNVNGGAIALGHPPGATGLRLVLTALHELKRRGGRSALTTLCVGGGQGAALALEAA